MAISVKESTDSLGYKTQTVYNGDIKVHEIRYNPDGKERFRREYTSEGVKQKETWYDYDKNTTTIDLFDEKGERKSSATYNSTTDIDTDFLLEEEHYTDGRMTSREVSNRGEEKLKLKTNTAGYEIEVDEPTYEEKYEDKYDSKERTSLKWRIYDQDNNDHFAEVFFDKNGNVTRMEEVDGYGTRTLHFSRQQVKETNSGFEGEDRRLAVINGKLECVEINRKNEKNQPVTEEFEYDQDNYITSHKVQDFDENGDKRERTTYYNAKEYMKKHYIQSSDGSKAINSIPGVDDIEDLEKEASWTRETLVNGVLRERTHNDFLEGDDKRHQVVTTRYDENGEISSITSTTSQNDSLTNVKRDAVVEYNKNKDFYEFNVYQKKGDQIVYRKIPCVSREKGVWHSAERNRNVLNNPFSYIRNPFEGNFNKETIEINGKNIKRTAFDADGNYTVTTYDASLKDYEHLPEYFAALDKEPYQSEEKYDLHNNLVSRKIRNEENNEEIISHYENNKLVSQTTLKNGKEEKIEYNETGLPMSQVTNQGETTIKKTFDDRGLVSTEVKDKNGRIVEDAKGNATYYDQNGNKINPMSDAEFEEMANSPEGQEIISEMLNKPSEEKSNVPGEKEIKSALLDTLLDNGSIVLPPSEEERNAISEGRVSLNGRE